MEPEATQVVAPTLVAEPEEPPTQPAWNESLPDRQPDEPPNSVISCNSSRALTATQHEPTPRAPEQDVEAQPAECPKPDDTPSKVQSHMREPGTEEIKRDLTATFDDLDIPLLGDTSAPRDYVGEHSLTQNAIRCRTKRIFKRRADGSAKVAESIFQEWHAGGEGKKSLEAIFKQCGYDPDTFSACKHVTLRLRKRLSPKSM